MKYLKVFNTTSDFEDYQESNDYIQPCVAYCIDDNIAFFDALSSSSSTPVSPIDDSGTVGQKGGSELKGASE